jgi:hypothetical protein
MPGSGGNGMRDGIRLTSTVCGLISAILIPAVGNAGADSFNGSWCDAETRLYVAADRIGFNDHTLCTSAVPVVADAAGQWSGAIQCTNVYVTSVADDGTVETFEMPMPELDTLTLIPISGARLQVRVGAADAGRAFSRCD